MLIKSLGFGSHGEPVTWILYILSQTQCLPLSQRRMTQAICSQNVLWVGPGMSFLDVSILLLLSTELVLSCCFSVPWTWPLCSNGWWGGLFIQARPTFFLWQFGILQGQSFTVNYINGSALKQCFSLLHQQSMGVLLKCRFWFTQSGVRPEILHFQRMPRFLDHILSSKVLCMCAKSLQSCSTLCNPMDCSLPDSYCPWHSPGKNIGVGCHSLLQGIILIQGSKLHLLCLLHCREILYH